MGKVGVLRRVPFSLARGTGAPATGVTVANISVIVRNSNNAATLNASASVTEDGLGDYFFDITALFSTTNGAGIYYGNATVNDTGPVLRDVIPFEIEFFAADIDDLAVPGDAMALTAAAIDAIWDELQAGHVTGGSFGVFLDAAISTRAVPGDAMALTVGAVDAIWDEDIVAAHGTADTSGFLVRSLGAVISQRANNPTLDALLGVADVAGQTIESAIATFLETTGPNPHGTGLWDATATATDWSATEREQIRFRLAMDGVQVDPTTGTGTIEDILTDTGVSIPALIASLNDISALEVENAVWDAARSSHVGALSFGGGVLVQSVNAGGIVAGSWTTAALQEIATLLETTGTNPHGTGSWATATGFAVAGDAMALTAAAIDTIWDELQAGHTTPGTFGLFLDSPVSLAGSPSTIATAVWNEALPGAFAGGSAGFILGTNLDALVSATPASVWSTVITANADRTEAGGALNAVRQFCFNRLEALPTASGTLTLYLDDGLTPLGTYTIRDFSNGALLGVAGVSALRGAFV